MAADSDSRFLLLALEAAKRGLGHVRPNPPVGAVIVKGGRVLATGWHRRAGTDHAEVAALKAARRKGLSVKGATLYVTLEPCSRPGRVGACTDAIAASGVRRVVYALADPNPTNRGRAGRILKRRGIVCERYRGDVAPFRRLIRAFAKHVTTGLPYVTVKIALSLDGRICDDFGSARWISSADARKATGELRERVDVVMVGAETVRTDNPSLLSHGRRNDDLWRAVVSKSGRLPKSAQVFTDDAKDRTLVYRNPRRALEDLGRRGFCHVLCEGGLELARSLAAEGLVDEWLTVLAPVVVGHVPLAEARRGRLLKEQVRCLGDNLFSGAVFGPFMV